MDNKTFRLLEGLRKIDKIFIEEDFEKFKNWKGKAQRILLMKSFKRTFKLIVCVNLNIPVLGMEWVEHLIEKKAANFGLDRFFLKRHQDSQAFDQLKAAFYYRKSLGKGFLTGHCVISKINFNVFIIYLIFLK